MQGLKRIDAPSFDVSHPSIPARGLQVGADGLRHRGVPAAAGAPLRGCVPGVALLQSHGGENARSASAMQ